MLADAVSPAVANLLPLAAHAGLRSLAADAAHG
jgi:hypothetical protein